MMEEPEAIKYQPINYNYDPTCIKFGFVSHDSCPQKPVCVICHMVLNEAMKLSKTHTILETKYAHLKDKSEDFFY